LNHNEKYLPYKFRYMGTEWTIRFGKVGRDERGLKYLGRTIWGKQEIRINSKLEGTSMYKTIWHEIIHIILGEHSDTQVIGTEELICRLSSGISHALDENPWLQQKIVKGEICP